MSISAYDINNMLYDKHQKDLFVSECKNGSTWFQHHSRLDAWVMVKSWQHLKYIGYEIKVSRGDFLQDNKYVNYLPMCNELYFVCPWKMIEVSEIPLEVGLIYVSKNCTRLITRKKAVFRKIEDPIDTLLYVLMSRCQVTSERNPEDNAEYWKRYIQDKSKTFDIGRLSSKKIRQQFEEKIINVQEENRRILKENEQMENKFNSVNYAVERLKEIGIDINDYNFKTFRKYGIDGIINKLTIGEQEEFKRSITMAKNSINLICDKLKI